MEGEVWAQDYIQNTDYFASKQPKYRRLMVKPRLSAGCVNTVLAC